MGVIFAVHSKPEPPAGGSRGRLANASVLYSEGGRVPDGNEEVQSAGTGNLQGQDDVSARFPPFSLAHPIFARPGRRRRRGPVPANRDDLTIPSARVLEVLSVPLHSVFSALLPRLQSRPPRTPLPHRDQSRKQSRPMQRPQLSTCATPHRAHRTHGGASMGCKDKYHPRVTPIRSCLLQGRPTVDNLCLPDLGSLNTKTSAWTATCHLGWRSRETAINRIRHTERLIMYTGAPSRSRGGNSLFPHEDDRRSTVKYKQASTRDFDQSRNSPRPPVFLTSIVPPRSARVPCLDHEPQLGTLTVTELTYSILGAMYLRPSLRLAIWAHATSRFRGRLAETVS